MWILYVIAAIVLAFWFVGFFIAHLGSLVHLALVIVVALVLYDLITRYRAGRRV